jgi:hypothetical protein
MMMPASKSWTRYYNELFPDPFSPPKAWQANVAGYLFERGYVRCIAALVLDYATRFGTVECCPDLWFDANDRAMVESKLPDAPDGEWDRIERLGGSIRLAVNLGPLPIPQGEWACWLRENEEELAELALLL